MRIALVAPGPVPPARGGAERAWAGIAQAFEDLTPHRCDVVVCAAPERNLRDIASSYLRFMDMALDDVDAVLSCKYPSWMVDHPYHDVFLFHRLRGLYDDYPAELPDHATLADPELAPLLRLLRRPGTRTGARLAAEMTIALSSTHADHPALGHPGPVGRELVHYLDHVGLHPGPHRRYRVLSETVARRAGGLPDAVPYKVVELPSNLPGLGPGTYEHFFTASRLDHPKRIDLLINAYRQVPGDVPLLIAGTGPEEARLRELAERDDRVQLLGEIEDDELAQLYRRALAVPFVPYDEDWGLVAVEALSSATPVVTCRDSGGPTDLISDGHTGAVVEPNAAALAAALSRFVTDPGLAERMGAEGLERSRRISWETVVEVLDPERSGHEARERATPNGWRRKPQKAVVLSTFAVHPPRHGGQLRSWHLYRRLAGSFDLELLCLGSDEDPPSAHEIEPGVFQRVVPRSAAHRADEARWDARAHAPVGDIVAGLLIARSPHFEQVAREVLDGCDLIVLAHPYLLDVAERFAPDVPFVYDAHNCEVDLKQNLLDHGPAADLLLERVADIEGRAVRSSVLCTACSADDASRLAELHGTDESDIVVVPNGVDVSAIPYTWGKDRDLSARRWLERSASLGRSYAHVALFIGSFHLPNIAAARQIAEIARSHPSTAFVLLGGHCAGLRADELPGNVLPVGVVSNTLKLGFLRSAGVALNPVVAGSGTNLKLVEYLAAGVPTVTSRVGARGLPIVDRVHAHVVDLEGTGETMEDLLSNPNDQMVSAARTLVTGAFDWSIISERFVAAIRRDVSFRDRSRSSC